MTQAERLKTEITAGTFVLKLLRSLSALILPRSYFLALLEARMTVPLPGLLRTLQSEESAWRDLGGGPPVYELHVLFI